MRKETLPLIHDYIIRYLTLADNAQVQDLCERCADYIELVTGKTPGQTEVQSIFTSLPPGKTYNDKFLLGILTSGEEQLIGILDAIRDYPTPTEWYLGLLLLDPQERSHGLGKKIYDTFERWAATRGAHAIRLSVVEQNEAAYSFWTHLGFTEIERTPPQHIGNREHRKIVMRRSIKPLENAI